MLLNNVLCLDSMFYKFRSTKCETPLRSFHNELIMEPSKMLLEDKVIFGLTDLTDSFTKQPITLF